MIRRCADFLLPLLFYVAVLRVVMVLLVSGYDRSGSLLEDMLMDARLTASTLFTLVPRATGAILAVHYPILVAVLCVVVGAVAVANGGDSRESRFRKRVA